MVQIFKCFEHVQVCEIKNLRKIWPHVCVASYTVCDGSVKVSEAYRTEFHHTNSKGISEITGFFRTQQLFIYYSVPYIAVNAVAMYHCHDREGIMRHG